MENSRKISIGVAFVVLILTGIYFVMSITSSFTGNVVDGNEGLIESEEVEPVVYAESSPGVDVVPREHGCSWDPSAQ